jgi:iron(III) transport system substrate-binding protein
MMTSQMPTLGGRVAKMVCVAIFTLPVACGGASPTTQTSSDTAGWAATVAAANKEGAVVFYSSITPEQSQALIDAFHKKYPQIQVQLVRNAESVLIPKIQQEQAAGAPGADVFIESTYDIPAAEKAAGYLAKPTGPDVDAYPAKSFFIPEAPIIFAQPFVLPYNSDLVKNPPKDYSDFLKPEFKGKIGTLRSNASAAIAAWYDFLRINYGSDYWTKLAAQKPQFFASAIPMTQSVASGEIEAALISQPASVSAVVKQGAPVKFNVPSKVFGITEQILSFTTARHPNAAKVFQDFTLSKDGEEALCGQRLCMPGLPNVPGTLPTVKVATYDPKIYTAVKVSQINAEWSAIFG